MTDISKCVKGCDKKNTCWRWLAPASDWQSYAEFKPDKDGNCDGYWNRKEQAERYRKSREENNE